MHASATSSAVTRRDALRRLGLFSGAALLGAQTTSAARAATRATPAPSLAGAQPGFYRFRIGEFEAMTLVDGQLVLPFAQSPFGLDQPPEDVRAALQEGFLPTEEVRLGIDVLLVRTKQDLVLVDGGCGKLFGPVGGRLLQHLATAGIQPDQVTAVILTHLHGDHFGGLFDAEFKTPVFKNARYIIGRREHDFWLNATDLPASRLPAEARQQSIQSAQVVIQALKGKWERVSNGDQVIDGIEFLETPGHTPGHLSVVFSSGQEQLVNHADVLHHHQLSFAHPEWHLAFDVDPTLAAETRRRVLDRAATARQRIFGVHLPFPGLGRVRSVSGRFEYVSEPWQPV